MCYESWLKEKEMMESEDKARREAREAIEKARLAAGKPKPATDAVIEPAMEREEATAT